MKKLNEAYDTEDFRALGYKIVDLLADHLSSTSLREKKVIDLCKPEVELEKWRDYEVKDLASFVRDLIERTIHIHNPGYLGHQVSGPLPLMALAGAVSDALNAGVGVYEMGAGATAIEKVVIEDFCKHLGYSSTSGGFLTSGGTLGNLTALLAARARKYQQCKTNLQYILVSEQAHYCAEKAARTMGLPPEYLIKIPADSNYRLDTSALLNEVQRLSDVGKPIMAVIASSCTTATGSYDDLAAILKITQSYNVWLHVDGAHGGPVIFSEKYKHLISGIAEADSVVIDAHKMMMIPAIVTAVLFKRSEDPFASFVQEADYLFAEKEQEWYNLAKRTYETTKSMMGIKCYLLFRYYGVEIIETYINHQYDLTRSFAKALSQRPNWHIAHWPMSNILCFRYAPSDVNEDFIEELNRHIRQRIVDNGEFYLVQTTLNGKFYLRVTLMNHQTTMPLLEDFCNQLENKAKEYMAEIQMSA